MPARNHPDTTFERPPAPVFSEDRIRRLLHQHYGLEGALRPLPSYIDLNFRLLDPEDKPWVIKLANSMEDEAAIDLQNRAHFRLASTWPGIAPEVRLGLDGSDRYVVEGDDGQRHLLRVLTYLPGQVLADAGQFDAKTWQSWGRLLAKVDLALGTLDPPKVRRSFRWDPWQAAWTLSAGDRLQNQELRQAVSQLQLRFLAEVERRRSTLPEAWIHHDGNEFNLICQENPQGAEVTGLFDFGDMVYTARVFEPAVACAYAMMMAEDRPLETAAELVAAYHQLSPLQEAELAALLPSTGMRLALSLLVAAADVDLDPDNGYISVHQQKARELALWLSKLDPVAGERALRTACGLPETGALEGSGDGLDRNSALKKRNRLLGPSLSLSYQEPLEIVRGRGCFLFDKQGRPYLDCVNNVCHVGHSHPKVVKAASRQMARLNTNSRYLHDLRLEYAERLLATVPKPLEVCYLLNSGSEANELALRLARTYTGRKGMVVLDSGYHGHTSSLIDLSAYKHDGPGGSGAPSWVEKVATPDPYRGPFRGDSPSVAQAYAAQVHEACAALQQRDRPAAGFLIEPLPGCGGQIVPPTGYLSQAFEAARSHGAVCIADEVQIGFGRVGSAWWAFQALQAVPDILTLGKPIGNGHPMAAVLTTREIADAFDNGMEFFSTFGGNPVSCAVGLAVLDVIEEEKLAESAKQTGERLQQGFSRLAEEYECIGEVRGLGLFLGVEFVQDRTTREPAADHLHPVIQKARELGVLLSSDGPHHNVLKLKPPMTFGRNEADLCLEVFEQALRSCR
ncbi:MAG: aminotransferase class III-fold pyridoxal phosphate-dependent enzyme [Planctomycetota bacterium]|nr:MAG: aminotransferase class III-fold pyridoxal phosphate-dependent enzyme [Planctomycetota bacterium]